MPWQVKDADRAQLIRNTYVQLLHQSIDKQTEPIIAWLKEQGIATKQYTIFPVIDATLTKAQLKEIAQHPSVTGIYHNEMVSEPASNVSTSTAHFPIVWKKLLNGGGIRMAIVEPGSGGGTNINNAADTCLDIVSTYQNYADADHESRVASIAACDYTLLQGTPYLPGIATGVDIVDGGYDPANVTFQTIMEWAVQTQVAHIVNLSMQTWPAGDPNSNVKQTADIIVDYLVRYFHVTVVAAAGNTDRVAGTDSTNVASPGKAWNAITVGNFDDRNNPNWSDDVMSNSSSWGNTSLPIEKPEVVAPGTNINTAAGQASGTSFAAPAVSGLAALLMQRDNQFMSRPAAVKAIIMASAAENVRDSRVIPDGTDLRDGAGGIDAALAEDVASNNGGTSTSNYVTCEIPCWWTTGTLYVAPGSSVIRKFKANQGERIRVAISWYANSTKVGSAYIGSAMTVNYNLYIEDSLGSTWTSSVNANNSYELVEFVIPKTDTYTIRAIRSNGDTTTESNDLAIAWSKQATYAPDVRRVLSGGWESTLYTFNKGTQARPVEAEFVDTSGSFLGNPTNISLGVNQVWTTQQPNHDWVGSGIIDGSEDLSLAIANRRGSGITPYFNAAYSGVSWTQADSIYYVPLVMKRGNGVSGVSNTEIVIENLIGAPVNVTIDLYGTPNRSFTVSVPAGGGYRYYIVYDGNVPDNWKGSAKISTGGTRIAVVAHLQTLVNGVSKIVQSFNGFPRSSLTTKWGIPIFASRLTNSLSTPVVVQNLSGSTIPVGDLDLVCTRNPGSPLPATFTVSNNAAIANNNGYFDFNPVTDLVNFVNNWQGSCRIDAGNYNVVAFMQMRLTNTNHAAAYEALPLNGGARELVFPLILRSNSGGDTTSVDIQNLSTSSSTFVRFWYYDTNGNVVSSGTCTLAAGIAFAHNHTTGTATNCGNYNLPVDWTGSLVVTSESQAIDGIVQIKNTAPADGDRLMAHNALR